MNSPPGTTPCDRSSSTRNSDPRRVIAMRQVRSTTGYRPAIAEHRSHEIDIVDKLEKRDLEMISRTGSAIRAAIAASVAALGAALVVGACGSNAAPADAAPGQPTLAAIRSDIFNGTCAMGSCHGRPTLAAKLDLQDNGLCFLLRSHTSCLFPTKFLVLPGKPEASFLMDKLRGTALDATPDPSCATTNEQMPPGQPSLPDSKISQIEAWIAAGASCGDDVAPDAGIDAGAALANVVSISAGSTMIPVGNTTQVTVTLNHGAPPGGQSLILSVFDSDDPSVLGFPPLLQVAEGVSSVMFDVMGNKVGSATIVASSGGSSQSIMITVM